MTGAPDYATPAGEFIAEWMSENDIDAAELSRRLGISRETLTAILEGNAPLGLGLALELEHATNVPARIWNQYDSLYNEDRARLAALTSSPPTANPVRDPRQAES